MSRAYDVFTVADILAALDGAGIIVTATDEDINDELINILGIGVHTALEVVFDSDGYAVNAEED